MNINEYIQAIKELGACGAAVEDALNYKTSQELWDDCKRGDWMLWLIFHTLSNTEYVLRKLTGTKAKCIRLIQHPMKNQRSKDNILAQCADIVRQDYPMVDELFKKGGEK